MIELSMACIYLDCVCEERLDTVGCMIGICGINE